MESIFDTLASPAFQAVISVAALVATIAIAVWSAWNARSREKIQRAPIVRLYLSPTLHFSEWRHAVVDIVNHNVTAFRLVSVRRNRPRSLRLWRFIGHATAPLGAASLQIDADLLCQPTPDRIIFGFEFLFKVQDTPTADSGRKIAVTFVFEDVEQGVVIKRTVRAIIPKLSDAAASTC